MFWGGGGYQALWNEAPFHNNQDLFVFKDDYSLVFGKHMLKAGGLFSTNKKNEDVGGFGSYENSAFWGSDRSAEHGGHHRQHPRRFPAKDMTFGFSESRASAGAAALARPRVLRVGFVEADPAHHLRLRCPLFALLQPVRGRRQDHELRSRRSFNAALGSDPCNGLLQAPGHELVQAAGLLGRHRRARTDRSSRRTTTTSRRGSAWRGTSTATASPPFRAGLGHFYLRERLSPGLNVGNNPPFVTTS